MTETSFPEGSAPQDAATPPDPIAFSPAQINVMAVVCAFAIATLYYVQPLLHAIGQTFQSSEYATSQLVMLGQLGYAAGLFLFVPIGDRLDRRKLIVALLGINTFCLAACAAAPTYAIFAVAIAVAGLTTITPQIIIPTVAGATPTARRGRAVGTLLSGMAAGILLGRALSGAVADFAGWRTVFVMAMMLNVLLAGAVWRLLPSTTATTDLPYGRLLHSLWRLFAEQPVLRAACLTGFFGFAGFSALWSTLAGLLAKPPYFFSASIVGSFGLLGIITIMSGPIIGRLTDRLGARFMIIAGPLVLILAFAFVSQTEVSIWMLIVGIVLIDTGYRFVLIPNQTRIYPLQADSHSRLNAVFMTFVFLGASFGSFCGAVAAHWGWHGVAIAGSTVAAMTLLLHLTMPLSKRQS